jgi:hypothetical protein
VALRLLARAAPLVLGAVAAAIWLRRRQPERPALPVRTGTPAPAPQAHPPGDRVTAPPGDRVTPPPPAGRFQHAPEHSPVDIVTVVDDLLGTAR